MPQQPRTRTIRGADMGPRASAEATPTARRSDLRQPPSPPTLPARTRCPDRAPAPAPAPAPETPAPTGPRPRPPGTYASAQLDPSRAAPAKARKITREFLARRDMQALTPDAELIASELVTNALARVPRDATGLAIIYAIHAAPTGLRLSVWDIGPGHPQPRPPDPDAETGRGLHHINHLTGGRWGWKLTSKSGGKVVYATLTQPTAPDAAL
jgi:hypothetical protein